MKPGSVALSTTLLSKRPQYCCHFPAFSKNASYLQHISNSLWLNIVPFSSTLQLQAIIAWSQNSLQGTNRARLIRHRWGVLQRLFCFRNFCGGFEHLKIFCGVVRSQTKKTRKAFTSSLSLVLHTPVHKRWSGLRITFLLGFYRPMKRSVWPPKCSSAQLEVLTSAYSSPPPLTHPRVHVVQIKRSRLRLFIIINTSLSQERGAHHGWFRGMSYELSCESRGAS